MEAIRKAFERCAKAFSLRPSLGRWASISRARIRQGTVCDIREGEWTFTADLPRRFGGSGTAPTPGAYSRAALGSGLAVGYMLHAARLRVPIASIEVEVQAEYDNCGLFGAGTAPTGSQEVRYRVTVESSAPEDDVRRVIEESDAHSPYLQMFTNAQPCHRTMRVVRVSGT